MSEMSDPEPDPAQAVDSTPAPEESAVDIHKPKLVHNWREFLSEIGVIVIGVLIALSGEQVVEWLHWKGEVSHAHEALREEIADNIFASLERIIVRPCIDEQLDLLKARVLADQSRLTPAPVFDVGYGPFVVKHPVRPWSGAIWQSVVSAQISAHFSQADQSDFAIYYTELDRMRDTQQAELDMDGELIITASPLPLDPGVRTHLVGLIERERHAAQILDQVGRQEIGHAIALMPELKARLADRKFRDRMSLPTSTAG